MGKGDKKSRRGKIVSGTYGVRRLKKTKKAFIFTPNERLSKEAKPVKVSEMIEKPPLEVVTKKTVEKAESSKKSTVKKTTEKIEPPKKTIEKKTGSKTAIEPND